MHIRSKMKKKHIVGTIPK